MKIIVSHDIDHITAFEHKNMLIPKFLIRASIELAIGVISFSEYLLRYKSIFIENKWQNLNEIMDFNEKNNIPTTFFVGMNNGMGLDYSLSNAKYWAKKINERNFDIGLHGIAYNSYDEMKKEYNELFKIINKDFGIRMHYLRSDSSTFDNLSSLGYLYDSTILKDRNPYKKNGMWEFPLHIMDVNIFQREGKRYTSKTLNEYKQITIDRIEELKQKNIKYMTLLFHDRYFDNSFAIWKEWYIWIIEYLKSGDYEFISYKDAIKELEK